MIKENSVDLASKSWIRMKYSQRKQLVTNMGYNPSFAKAKTMPELVHRGGGMVASSFLKVVNEFKKRNPTVNRINW